MLAGLVVLTGAVVRAAEPVSVEPVVLLDGGGIAGCGFKAALPRSNGSAAGFQLLVTRDGRSTLFTLSAESGDGPALTSLRLATATLDSAVLFPAPAVNADGRLSTLATLEDFTGASLMQELMVSGGRVTITEADGEAQDFPLPQPMPPAVRQAYLTCAGDLVRPEGG